MSKLLLKKLFVLVLIVLLFSVNAVFARYIINNNYIDLSSLAKGFYFDSWINKDYSELVLNQSEKFMFEIKNYSSDEEYNDFDVTYDFSVDNDNFELIIEDENNKIINGNKNINNVNVFVKAKDITNLLLENTVNVFVKAIVPYYKELQFPITIINNAALIGEYVEYDVSYTDVFSKYEFSSIDGWRILDPGVRNADGTYSNTKIITTGVPMKLYYNAAQNPTTSSNANYKWWGSASQVNSRYGLNLSAWESGMSRYFAAYGLEYKFISVPMEVGTTATKNKGVYTKITNGEATNTATGAIFMNSNAASVHAVTVEEMNKALNSVNGDTKRGDKTLGTVNASVDKRAMFYLRSLNNYKYSSSTTAPFWLGSPNNDNTGLVRFQAAGTFAGGTDSTYGIRPVIELNKPIYLEDGIWKILE